MKGPPLPCPLLQWRRGGKIRRAISHIEPMNRRSIRHLPLLPWRRGPGRGGRFLTAPTRFNGQRSLVGFLALCILSLATTALAQRTSRSSGTLVYEVTSPYHRIRVVDEAGVRTLYFDAGMETRMSL